MASSGNTNQVTVQSTGPTLIVGQNTGRKAVVITNLGTTAIYIGFGTGAQSNGPLTISNGQLLPGVVGASISIPSTSAIWGIAASSTQAVSFMDV